MNLTHAELRFLSALSRKASFIALTAPAFIVKEAEELLEEMAEEMKLTAFTRAALEAQLPVWEAEQSAEDAENQAHGWDVEVRVRGSRVWTVLPGCEAMRDKESALELMAICAEDCHGALRIKQRGTGKVAR